MDKQGQADTPAADVPLEGTPATDAPAEPTQPPSDQDRVTTLESEIATLRTELATATSKLGETDGRSRGAQRTADQLAARLERRIERLASQLDAVATRGMDENEARTWKLQQELEKERESRTTTDSNTIRLQQEEEFRVFSSTMLAEEQLDPNNPTLKAAFDRFAATAKDPSDWKVALTRAIAEVRKDEAKTAAQKTKEAVDKAREDERKKLLNKSREASGPLDTGNQGAISKKPVDQMDDAEFAAYWEQRRADINRRRMQQSIR